MSTIYFLGFPVIEHALRLFHLINILTPFWKSAGLKVGLDSHRLKICNEFSQLTEITFRQNRWFWESSTANLQTTEADLVNTSEESGRFFICCCWFNFLNHNQNNLWLCPSVWLAVFVKYFVHNLKKQPDSHWYYLGIITKVHKQCCSISLIQWITG